MYTVSKTFSFCYGHRLVGEHTKCRHLHGHTAKVTISLRQEKLDEKGMVVHFAKLKETIGKWIDDEIDHTMLLSENDPIKEMLAKSGERFLLLPFSPTAENLARYIFEKTKEFGFPVEQVELWESENAKAMYSI